MRRVPYCLRCTKSNRKEYYKNNRNKLIADSNARGQALLDEGGDKALDFCFSTRLSSYKKETRDNCLPKCDLTREYLVRLFNEQNGMCYYTGEKLLWNTKGVGKGHQPNNGLSVDRLDPHKGYVIGNVVLCGHQANTSKGRRNEEEFYAFCEKVLALRKEREVKIG